MKSILEKKWIGPLLVFLLSIGMSISFSVQITPYLKKNIPIINETIDSFLPITIQNGEITQPVNTVISKTIFFEKKPLKIVLDTRSDTLDINTLSEDGWYFSKKCLYSVAGEKRERQCLNAPQNQEAFTIDKGIVQTSFDYIKDYISLLLYGVLSLLIFCVFYLIILFYTVILHWIIALYYKTTFGQTLFVNTLFYIALMLFEKATNIYTSFFLTALLLIVTNLFICKNANEKKNN